jgi:hypothetical protein
MDILHPAAKVRKWYDGTYVRYEVTRVALCQGLAVGFGSANVLASSLFTLGIPKLGTPHDGEPGRFGAVVTGYDTGIIPQSDTSCYLLIFYSVVVPTVLGPQIISMRRTTVLSTETTQIHPLTKKPIVVISPMPPSIKDPSSGKTVQTGRAQSKVATNRYARSLKKVTLSAVVKSENIDAIHDLVGSVNDSKWFDKPKGYWRIDDFDDNETSNSDLAFVEIGLVTRVNEPWLQYDLWWDPLEGQYSPVPADALSRLQAALKSAGGYAFDTFPYPGITATGFHPTADFIKKLGVGTAKDVAEQIKKRQKQITT